MQQGNSITLSPFKNYYCEALPCSLGKYCDFEPADENRLSREDIKTLCDYTLAQNALAGVKEIFVKLPYYVDIENLFEKYKMLGKIIVPALQIESILTKALAGEKLVIEIDNFSDLTDEVLSKIADFVGSQDLPTILNLGDNLTEVGKVVNKFKMSPTELAESYGFLDRQCFVRGVNHVDKDDLLLLKNYDAFIIVMPRDDATYGKGFVNGYNLIYHGLSFGFGSGKCYNIDMLGEGRLHCQNTANLLSKGGLISFHDTLQALSCGGGQIEVTFDCDARRESLLEEKVCLGKPDRELTDKVKQIAKRLKEKN